MPQLSLSADPLCGCSASEPHSSSFSSFTSWTRSVGRSGPHQSPSSSARDSSRGLCQPFGGRVALDGEAHVEALAYDEPALLDLPGGLDDHGQWYEAALGQHRGLRPPVPPDAQQQPTRRRVQVEAARAVIVR